MSSFHADTHMSDHAVGDDGEVETPDEGNLDDLQDDLTDDNGFVQDDTDHHTL
jgi:hypothetical protein